MQRRRQRPYLDLYTDWADEPVLHATAVETGVHTRRTVTVAELRLVIVKVTDSYDPMRVEPYRTVEEGLAAADRIMALPDTRGIMRDWRIERR